MRFYSGDLIFVRKPLNSQEGKIIHKGVYNVVEKWENFLLIDKDNKRYKIPSNQLMHVERIGLNFIPVGKHNHIDDNEFDPEELKMGIDVEFEHTNNPDIAKAIAKDHLAECSDYYTRLEEMEEECEEETDFDSSYVSVNVKTSK